MGAPWSAAASSMRCCRWCTARGASSCSTTSCSAAPTARAQRRLAAELTDALLERRQSQPDLRVLLITDPVNERYGSAPAQQLQLLRAAGVAVVLTDLDVLRDPNVLYSSLWRLTLQWWDGPPGALGASARHLNFKANHRKLIIADDGHGSLTARGRLRQPAGRPERLVECGAARRQ